MEADRTKVLGGQAEMEAISDAVEAEVLLDHRRDRYPWPKPDGALHAIHEGDLSQFKWRPADGRELTEFLQRYAPRRMVDEALALPRAEYEALLGAADVESAWNPFHATLVAAAKRGAVRGYRSLLAAEAVPVDADGMDDDDPRARFLPPVRMQDHEPAVVKRRILKELREAARTGGHAADDCIQALYAEGATLSCSHPVGTLNGHDDINCGFWRPLKEAMPGMSRRDDILMGGRLGGRDWIAATGYYQGEMFYPLWGLKPVGLVRLRFGEIHAIERGRIVGSHVILDMVDLLTQAGACPISSGPGLRGHCPGPAAQDGLLVDGQSAALSRCALDRVDPMLSHAASVPDDSAFSGGRTDVFRSAGTMWYGPGGIGTRRGGGYCCLTSDKLERAGMSGGYLPTPGAATICDGAYVAAAGWPAFRARLWQSENAVAPYDDHVSLRAVQFWRCDGSSEPEGWALADLPHLHLQFGRDIWAEGLALQAEHGRPGAKRRATY